ncbi:hypothetical protein DLM75_11540 [Leptospira stimsonii]|uniref:Uncharacterized protein n=1 Tax=Leptospira stimsonii TaxID=2202203 RepID=A0A396Z286_9LEPT|nr:hypothetical protein DLM75_11540 [Leptospira stimsonii]
MIDGTITCVPTDTLLYKRDGLSEIYFKLCRIQLQTPSYTPEKTGFNTPFGIDLAYIGPRGLDEAPEQTVEFDPLEYEKRTSM